MNYSFRQALDYFLLDQQLRNSETTVRSYKTQLDPLMKYLAKHDVNNIADVKEWDIKVFLGDCKARGLSSHTVEAYRRAAHAFFKFLEEEEMVARNPVEKVKKTNVGHKVKEPFKYDDLKKLLRSYARHIFTEHRNYMIVLFLFDSGARLKEILSIKMQDISLEDKLITITGKGNRERYIILGVTLQKELVRYLAHREHWLIHTQGKDSDYLFPSQETLQTLQSSSFGMSLRRRRKRLGIKGTAHDLRRLWTVMVTEQGMPSATASKMLGQSDLRVMEQYYYSLDKNGFKKAHKKYSPLDKGGI